MKKHLFFSIFIFLLFGSLLSQSDSANQRSLHLRLDFPLFDVNHWKNAAQTGANLGSVSTPASIRTSDWTNSIVKNPSMYQSSALTLDLTSSVAYGTQILTNKLIKPKRFWGRAFNVIVSQGIMGIFNFSYGKYPLSEGWVHEEYHRAVMATNQVASKDPFDSFNPPGGNVGSVSNIYDSELAKFKKNDPYSFNRMLIAGSEGEIYTVKKLQENNFYHNANLPVELVTFLYTMQSNGYFNSKFGGSNGIDSLTFSSNKSDGKDVSKRDFTGHDYSGWVWHLFKPNVPYDSLGIHPSGVGVDRYVWSGKLTTQEKEYYESVKSKVWLNYLNPMLFGFRKIKIKSNTYVNFAVQYQPTSFGTDKSVMLYYMNSKNKIGLGLHQYRNYETNYFALEANLVDKTFQSLNKLSFDARAMVGTQPKNQEFFTKKADAFVLVSTTGYYKITHFMSVYCQIQGKSKGWVAGDEYLKSMFRSRMGLLLRL